MSDTIPPIASAQDPSGRAASGARRGGRLVRRTFLIALALVCGGLLTSGVAVSYTHLTLPTIYSV